MFIEVQKRKKDDIQVRKRERGKVVEWNNTFFLSLEPEKFLRQGDKVV